jgi:4-hydroxy-2-oxoheptanedioate aldolase
MKQSKVLQKLRAGENVCSFKLNLCSPQASELASSFGFDCIWLDMEHVAQDWMTISAQNWAARMNGSDVMIRVPRGSYSDLVKPFEIDAAGILVPHIMNLEDARNVIHYTRFHPMGRRPIDGGNADGGYGATDFHEYLQQSNERRFIALQIEDPEPLDDLEAIAALDGYDILFFGPGDFSHGIGAPGDWDNPLLLKTRERIAEVARRHGKFAATTGTIENARQLIDMGYQMINLGADVIGLNSYCGELMDGWGKCK